MKVAETFFDRVVGLIETMPESCLIEPDLPPQTGEVLCDRPMDPYLMRFYTVLQKIQQEFGDVRQKAATLSAAEKRRIENLLEGDERKLQLLKVRFAADVVERYPELDNKPHLVIRKGRRIGWKAVPAHIDVVSISIS